MLKDIQFWQIKNFQLLKYVLVCCRVIISASCGVEPSRVVNYKPMLDQAIERSRHKPKNTIILQRTNLVSALHNTF